MFSSKRVATQVSCLAHRERHAIKSAATPGRLLAWRLRRPLRAEPSYAVSYSSRNVTLSVVTIVGRGVVVVAEAVEVPG